MTDETIVSFPLPNDSHVLTFDLERANLRGRIARLGKILDDILSPHRFPEPIEKLLVETMVLSVLLSSMLKYEGIFILQAQGDGIVTRLVSDITSSGDIRGTAGFKKEELEKLLSHNVNPDPADLYFLSRLCLCK